MNPFSNLLTTITQHENAFHVVITEDWQQGRTTYGGLTAALCVEAAIRGAPGLPPLRAAQFTFVGPAAGRVRMTPKILRRGKSTVFMSVDLIGEAGLATHATLVFAAARTSAYRFENLPPPTVPKPDDAPDFFGAGPGPTFAHHFDYRRAGGEMPRSGAAAPFYALWLRHRDVALGGGIPALVALADAPPPAAMALFTQPAPISTMTWYLDLFDIPAEEGAPWRLMTCAAERVADGYSTQEMIMWSEAGVPLAMMRQNVAIFT
jgi:acyl-CoA thioesterase